MRQPDTRARKAARACNAAGRRLICSGLALATMVCGLAIRLGRLGLPAAVTKYGGSALWAAMLYLLVAALLPRSHPLRAGVWACMLAWAVEWFKLLRTPALDAFEARALDLGAAIYCASS